MGYRYDDSPVVEADNVDAPEFDGAVYTPTTTPGARAPHITLSDGSSPLDSFRAGYTLVTFAGDAAAKGLLDAAEAADVPLTVLALDDESARTVYQRDYVLVRPDGHVAWRGDTVPGDAETLLAHVTGRG